MKKLSSYLQIFRSHLYHQFFTDELFKLLSLDQFLCADEKHERAVGRSQHTVDLVDADVAVFCRLLGGQCHFQMDRNGADAILYVKAPLKDQSDIKIITEKDYISHPKPNGYRSLHLTIRLPVFFAEKEIHVPVEIQLRTIAMDFWASLEHTIRYKKNLPINAEIETELKECADSSREWDSKMEHLLHILTLCVGYKRTSIHF